MLAEETHDRHRRFRRALRRRATKPEQLIWAVLRNRRLDGWKFRRQHSIEEYIVDFVCLERKLIIELDGGYHDATYEADMVRQQRLDELGFTVLRFSNEDVLADVEAVAIAIRRSLNGPPHPNPLPHGGVP